MKVGDFPPRTSNASEKNVTPNFAQLYSRRQKFSLICPIKRVSCFCSRVSERVGLQRRSNRNVKCSRFPRFPSREKVVSGTWLPFWNEVLFPLLVRDSHMSKQTLIYLETGHVLPLRLLNRDTQWHVPHRFQEFLLYRTGISFRRRRQGHPNCIWH